jgi:hypothetical protein
VVFADEFGVGLAVEGAVDVLLNFF